MKIKVITIAILVMLTSCFNAVHNKDAAKNYNPVGFKHCNQTLGTKFIEGNCTKAYDYRLKNTRICSVCPNSRFTLTADSLFKSIYIDSLSQDDFNKYLKHYTSEYGDPSEGKDATHQFFGWTLLEEKIGIDLIKKADATKNGRYIYALAIDDLKVW